MTWVQTDDKKGNRTLPRPGALVRTPHRQKIADLPPGADPVFLYGRASALTPKALLVDNESWTEAAATDRSATDSARWKLSWDIDVFDPDDDDRPATSTKRK
jgi:hypothetical protein